MYYVLNFIAAMQVRLDDAKDRGATATEYALLVALIAIVITVGVTAFGSALSDWFSHLAVKIGLKDN
jgi:pilus assembly protein Flp/PilA